MVLRQVSEHRMEALGGEGGRQWNADVKVLRVQGVTLEVPVGPLAATYHGLSQSQQNDEGSY